ncbi:SDR family oxidoreductase [Kitasatospora sp. NPDC085879]|uniref:SDR family oxidoreductase n=1 Tax=Kitasatospora sp. NPDC085879 TaxID=3154769 RepID=UPI00344A5E90
MARRWLVTGCSSGLGLALATAVAEAGDLVLATARKPDTLAGLAARHPDRVLTAALDIRDPGQCESAVATAVDRFGGLDVLVNNAGSGLFGTVEEASDEELRDQLELLVVAPWRLARLALPVMRAQRAGHIVNVSSLAGRMAFPGLAAYVAGKYALEGMTQALAAEAGPLGIRVTAVEPGGFATGYGDAITRTATRLPAYAATTDPMRDGMHAMRDNPELGRPEDFAWQVLRLVAAESTPLRLPVGVDAFAHLAAVEEAGRAELAAARAFVLGE